MAARPSLDLPLLHAANTHAGVLHGYDIEATLFERRVSVARTASRRVRRATGRRRCLYDIPMRSAGSSHRFHTPPERSLAGALIIFAGAPSQSLFLTQPRYSLAVDDPSNIWAIGLLFVVGLIASGVAFTSRRRAADAERLGMQAAIVQRYSRDVVAADNVDSILSITSRYLATLFRAPAVAMLVADDMVVSIKRAGDMEPQEAELGAAKSSLATGSVVRGGVNPNETSRFDFWPVRTAEGSNAVLGLATDPEERPATPDTPVETMANVLALALDRQRR